MGKLFCNGFQGRLAVTAAVLLLSCLPLAARPYGDYRIDRFQGVVTYEGLQVYGADVYTFRDLGFGYGKDSRHVYRFGQVLEFVDPSGFRVDGRFAAPGGAPGGDWCDPDMGRGYYVDSFDAYYDGRVIKGAHVTSFKVLGDGYAKDSFNVYWCGREIHDVSSTSFKVLGSGYAKDAFNIYWHGREIEGASSTSFKVLGNGYAKDAFNKYYMGRKVR